VINAGMACTRHGKEESRQMAVKERPLPAWKNGKGAK